MKTLPKTKLPFYLLCAFLSSASLVFAFDATRNVIVLRQPTTHNLQPTTGSVLPFFGERKVLETTETQEFPGNVKITGYLDLAGSASAPTAAAGRIYYDTDDYKTYFYNNSTWTEMGVGASPWTDGGDYLYPTNKEDIYIYDSGGTEYIWLKHDGTDGVIRTKTGDLALLPAGNVGIGTTGPSTKLHVNGGDFLTTSSGTNTRLIVGEGVGYDQYGVVGWNTANDFMYIEAVAQSSGGAGNNLILQAGVSESTSGNVGIGTTGPTDLLHLYAGANRKGIYISSDGNASAFGDIGMGAITTSGFTTGLAQNWSISYRKDGYFSGSTANTGMSMEFYAAKKGGGYYAPLSFQSDGDVILASGQNATTGNVGIGTTGPLATLSVGDSLGSFAGYNAISLGTSDDNSYFGIGQDSTHYAQLKWDYDATPNNAIFKVVTNAYNNDMWWDAGDIVLQSQSGGNVGIGTTGPSKRLVVGGGATSEAIEIYATSAGWSEIYFGDALTGADSYVGYIAYQHTDNHMEFATNGAERMMIDSGGSVGIGTTGPQGILDIASAAPLVYFDETDQTDPAGDFRYGVSGDSFYIQGRNAFDTAYLNLMVAARSGSLYLNAAGDSGNVVLQTGSTDKVTLQDDGDLIVNSGNVGIGTTGPIGSLDVYGSNKYGYFGGIATGRTVEVGVDASGYAVINAKTGRGGTLSVVDLTLQATGGNVGIGTTGPGEKLDVQGGNINVSGKVEMGTNPCTSTSCSAFQTSCTVTCPAGTYVTGCSEGGYTATCRPSGNGCYGSGSGDVACYAICCF